MCWNSWRHRLRALRRKLVFADGSIFLRERDKRRLRVPSCWLVLLQPIFPWATCLESSSPAHTSSDKHKQGESDWCWVVAQVTEWRAASRELLFCNRANYSNYWEAVTGCTRRQLVNHRSFTFIARSSNVNIEHCVRCLLVVPAVYMYRNLFF